MISSLQDLRAFAVRQRLDVSFHDHSTGTTWTVTRRGLVAQPAIGDVPVARVEDTLEAADEFLLEGDKQPPRRLSGAQLLELMARHAAATGAARDQDGE